MAVIDRTGRALAAAALTMMAAGPALADPGPRHDRDRDDRRHERRHHDDDDNGSVGGFVLGALLAGGLVAALTSKKKAPQPLPADVAFVPVAMTSTAGTLPSQADEDAAVAACAASAEGEARRAFPVAQVATIHRVDPVGPGFAIKGDLLLRTSYRDAGERRAFRCSVDGDAVNGVTVEGLSPAS